MLLEMRGISKAFGGVKALSDVNLAVKAGEIHAVVGENGAGKSTLMKALCGACIADGGEILSQGRPVRLRNAADARALGVAVIFQEYSLVPDSGGAGTWRGGLGVQIRDIARRTIGARRIDHRRFEDMVLRVLYALALEQGHQLLGCDFFARILSRLLQDRIFHDFLIDHLFELQPIELKHSDHLKKTGGEDLLLRELQLQSGRKQAHQL